jgi:hypothetical protein
LTFAPVCILLILSPVSAGAGGTLVTVTGPTEARPSGGLTIDFVVVPALN